MKQFVDDQARFGVKSAVRLIAKQVLGIHTDGSGYGNTFLHATTDLSWELALGTNQIDAVKTVHGTLLTLTKSHSSSEASTVKKSLRMMKTSFLSIIIFAFCVRYN